MLPNFLHIKLAAMLAASSYNKVTEKTNRSNIPAE